MNRVANTIKNRLSLRPPQEKSLYILAELADKLTLTKVPRLDKEGIKGWLNIELEIVKNSYPTCTDFERNFPSICFALATGVGKTRLMGAFVVYLYLAKGIKNFFVLAPNLTIYDKLINDFSVSTHPKYVFQGIGEFVHNQPVILRTAASMTLREQTIGRGLRLPYGKRTGHIKTDKLTIVAHDRFQEIIDEANKPDSIIRRENIIEINTDEISQPKEVVTSVSSIEKKFQEEQERIDFEMLKRIWSYRIEDLESYFILAFLDKYGIYPICNNKSGFEIKKYDTPNIAHYL